MEVGIRRRRGAPRRKRINLYLSDQTFERVEEVAQRRGVETGAAARLLIEERLNQMVWRKEDGAA